jgi:Flp pilus assembly protein TadD
MKPPIPTALRQLATALVLAAGFARAQAAEPPPPPLPPEYSETSRAAFALGMKEARTLMAQKQYEDAITRLDSLTRDRPREPQARFLKGVALTALGRDDEALAQFLALAADFPELPEPHNNLAALYARKGQLDLARRELELAIAADPSYGIANENLGDIYVRLAAQQYELAATLTKNSKTLPVKLKLVRDMIAAKPETTAAAPAAAAEGKPGDASAGQSAASAPPASSAPIQIPANVDTARPSNAISGTTDALTSDNKEKSK